MLAKMLMRSEKELTGMNWIKFVHDEDRERIIDAWQFAQENGSDFDEVYRFNLPTGDILRVRGVVYQMIDKHNEPKGYFGTLMRLEK